MARVILQRAELLHEDMGRAPWECFKAAQEVLLVRAKANSLAQLGKYTGEGESEESKKGMLVMGYVY